ncbi:MAG: DUF4391 domain-containing protein [Nitrospira sp.]|nr:DUF4391 domain-containing protein [Nitrospira sp.]
MSFEPVIDALELPADARIDHRVPKKLLTEHGAPTAADRRLIQESIEELMWVAALKPTNIAVPAFRDDVREYLEIAVLTATFRGSTKPTRLIELTHRAIPYPVLLLSGEGDAVSLSLAHKRWSQGEKGAVVVEDVRGTAPFDPKNPTREEALFISSLSVSGLPKRDLYALYQGWLDRVAALEAARITGRYFPPDSDGCNLVLRENLDARAGLQREIAALRAQAEKEKQLNRRVQLNLEIKRLEAKVAATEQTL